MRTILCFGDSNVFGYDPSIEGARYDAKTRWTKLLQRMLGEEFDVIEAGLNGRTISSKDQRPNKIGTVGKDYLLPCVDSHVPLDMIIVMLGTNELKFGKTAKQIGEMLETDIIDVLLNHDYCYGTTPKILIISSPKVCSKYAEGTEEICQELDEVYKEIAKRKNLGFISAVDLEVGTDKIHFTKASHAKLAKRIFMKVTMSFV